MRRRFGALSLVVVSVLMAGCSSTLWWNRQAPVRAVLPPSDIRALTLSSLWAVHAGARELA